MDSPSPGGNENDKEQEDSSQGDENAIPGGPVEDNDNGKDNSPEDPSISGENAPDD